MDFNSPCIGIVGSAGAYGRWLQAFFAQRMGLEVLGHDPADPESNDPEVLLERADVLLFSAPIRITAPLIRDWAARAAGREAGRLWLDVTSLKAAPVAAMLASRAEVAGLHPLTAPPKSPTLKGRVLAVCRARLEHWTPWLEALLAALEAQCVEVEPEQHDRAMALVQAMVHATHLAQAGVLRENAVTLGDLDALLPLRSAAFELDVAIAARILSQNPAIYEDIQFGNAHVPEVLRRLSAQLDRIAGLVEQGDEAARVRFRDEVLGGGRAAFGAQTLAAGNDTFERVGYLLADLTDACSLSVYLPRDRPGSLRALLHVFEQHGVNIASLHSSRTRAGELHFRFGFDRGVDALQLQAVTAALHVAGIGRVLAAG
ncbi:prephenate dehydrogenase [Thermomonas sp.]|uniref:prephenate dehydrogenase n=1 Tax=Thermomonas sp. TaxID=1971895 RepID=UPI002CCD8FAC|nr:prephenate dehydrogenase [Thermomonas sp.]HRO62899.1 prephenate dehydrogenase [Thermomonas sp.]